MALKINMIYNQYGAGFTETFYLDTVSDPYTYLNTLSSGLFTRATAFRAAGTILYAIRASVVGGNRLSFTRIINVAAPGPDEFDPTPDYSAPDVVSTDAVYQIVGLGGTKRAILLRGLRDRDVIRLTNGVFAPTAALESQIQAYFRYIANFNWAIRFEKRPPTDGLLWYPILSVTRVALNAALSILEPSVDPFTITMPTAITIQGVPKDDLPGMPSHAVAVATGTDPRSITIRYRYRGHDAITYPLRMRLSLTQYQYSIFQTATFLRFSERKTGRSFGQPRGRARVGVRQY